MATKNVKAIGRPSDRTERGRRLDALAISAGRLFAGPLRPGELAEARRDAAALVELAEPLMHRFLGPRMRRLGVWPHSADLDDLRQHLRAETFAGVRDYDPRFAYSTYLVTNRWFRAVDRWKAHRGVIRLASDLARTGRACGTRDPAMARRREADAARARSVRSIDAEYPGPSGLYALAMDLSASMEPPGPTDPEREELAAAVREAVAVLPVREREILLSRFGLRDGESRQTLGAIGARLGITKERVRQIEYEGMQRLRKALADLAVGLKDAPE